MDINDTNDINNPHDKTYKSFLSHKKTFLEFIKGFVNEDWVNEIDKDNIKAIDKSFILKDYEEKEADVIYELKIKDTTIYFYILLELQLTQDNTMPYRLLIYMTELWKQYFSNVDENERKRKDFRLPAIIPMLLYNGASEWTVPIEFIEYQQGYGHFKNNLLNFKYILFDVNRYSEDELYKIGNLISSVFVLDQNVDKEEFVARLHKLVNIIKKFNPEQWIRFKGWMKKIILPKIPIEYRHEIIRIIDTADIMEVDNMVMNLEVNIDKWVETERQQGKEEGFYHAAKALLSTGKTVEETIKLLNLPESVANRLREEYKTVH